MIRMLAPAGNMTFASLPSGSTYVSDANGIILITNNSVADQLALIAASCKTLNPIPGGAATTQTGTAYTLQASDQGNSILFTANNGVNVTLPNSMPVGFLIELFQIGTGQVSAVAASGASIVTPNMAATPNQYSSILCLVISNTTGTNAQWNVVAEPLQTGGLIGAATLPALYTQDNAAHYAQFTVAQVIADGTQANNGVWLKTGSGNGSGNWAQESAITLASLNTQVLANAAAILGKADYNQPQGLPAVVNAVRNRFTETSDTSTLVTDSHDTIVSYLQRAFTSQMIYNANVYSNFGEPQALLLSDANGTAGQQYPRGGAWISVADLAAIGIIPSDSSPPVISISAAIDVASAINQTINNGVDGSYGQVYLVLRYAGNGATTTIDYQATAGDVYFANSTTHPTGPAGAVSDAHWAGVMSSSRFTTGNVKGYTFNNVEVPATWSGLALTGIAIELIGYVTTNGASSIQGCLFSIVAGSGITPGQACLNPGDRPTTTQRGDAVHQLDVTSAEKIIVLGDSHGVGNYPIQGKNWINKVSQYSDWNFENYSESGDTLQVMMNRVRSGALMFGQSTFPQYNAKRVIIISEINDQKYETVAQFANDLRTCIQVCRQCGLVPTIATEDKTNWPTGIQSLFRGIAEECDVDFIDLTRWWKIFNPPGVYSDFFYQGHPGVRTAELVSEPIRKYLRGIERPNTGFKIFRKRAGVAVSSLDNLLFDTNFERTTLFKEIDVGAYAISVDGSGIAQYYDALTSGSAGYTVNRVPSEYLRLQNGGPVNFSDYALIEATFPETPSEVRLILSDPNVQVYVRDALASPYPSSATYEGFAPTGSPSIATGAVYTTSDSYFGGQQFTYVATINGLLMFTPSIQNSVGHTVAGTLSKVSGTGDSSISYSSATVGFDATYYAQYGLPTGHWTQIIGSYGVYTLQASDIRGKLRHDKMSFLLYEASAWSIAAPRIMWRGQIIPKTPSKAPWRKTYSERPAAYGNSELLGNNIFTTLTNWTSNGTLTNAAPADGAGSLPYNPLTGSQLVDRVVISSSNNAQQAFTYSANYQYDREIEVTAYLRNFPAIYVPNTGGPPITTDTCDDALIEIDIVTSAGACPYRERVGLWWTEIRFRTILPLGTTSATLQIAPATTPANGLIELCYASVKFVDI